MPTWKTEKGAYVPVEQMHAQHLANAYRLAVRKVQEYAQIGNQLASDGEASIPFTRAMQIEHEWIGWASTFARELSRRGYHRIGDRFVKHSI